MLSYPLYLLGEHSHSVPVKLPLGIYDLPNILDGVAQGMHGTPLYQD